MPPHPPLQTHPQPPNAGPARPARRTHTVHRLLLGELA